MSRFTRRLEALEARAPRREDVLVLTKGMTEAECSAAYGRLLRGETLESVFPGVQFEPDPEPHLVEDAFDGLTAIEASALYTRMLHAKGRDESNKILREQIARNRSRRL